MSNVRDFGLEFIFACTAPVRGGSGPCTLDGLLDLIEHMTGERTGPSVLPNFQIQVAMCGLALIRQHPQLGKIDYLPPTTPQEYEQWLAKQERQLGKTLPVRSIMHDDLSPYRAATMRAVDQMLGR